MIGGRAGGGPDQAVVRGPDHDPCAYRSLSAHGLLAWHMAYSHQGNDDPPVPAPDRYYGDDPDVRWALAHCPANAGRDVLVWWPVGGRPPASLIDALRQRARDAVPFPVLAQQGAPTGEPVGTVHHPAPLVAVGRSSRMAGGPGPGLDPRHRDSHRDRHTPTPHAGIRGPATRRSSATAPASPTTSADPSPTSPPPAPTPTGTRPTWPRVTGPTR